MPRLGLFVHFLFSIFSLSLPHGMAGVRALLITPLTIYIFLTSSSHQSSHRGTSHPFLYWIIAVGSGIARSPVPSLMDRTGGLVFYLLFFSTWLSAIFVLRYFDVRPTWSFSSCSGFFYKSVVVTSVIFVWWRDVAPAVTTWPDLMGRVTATTCVFFTFLLSCHASPPPQYWEMSVTRHSIGW